MQSMSIYLNYVTFLEISRNCLVALNDLPGDACSKTQIIGFHYELPGSWRRPARRHKLYC